ncbi:MAG: hypothetical protein ACTSXG_04305 [Alphaproteobacteria bacterium]
MNIRGTLILCFTLLVGIVISITLFNQQRYVLIPQAQGVFVFDQRNSLLNYCDNDSCKLVTPQGIKIGTQPAGVSPTGFVMAPLSSIPQNYGVKQQLSAQPMVVAQPLVQPQINMLSSSLQTSAFVQPTGGAIAQQEVKNNNCGVEGEVNGGGSGRQ